jgi:PilZ domain-containing protein
MGSDQRGAGRAQLALALVLKRHKGGPVSCRTLDLGTGGARVTADRPLRVDELLVFDLVLEGDAHVDGHCRVLRQQGLNEYALRFEDVDAAARELLSGVVARTA